MMNYHVLTLFPEMILEGLNTSIIGRAIESGAITLEAVNIRDYSDNKHNKVDDYPYGGGAGMVMQAEPVYRACKAVEEQIGHKARVIYVTPQGSVFNQAKAKELSGEEDLIFLCGHYEGIDERVLEEVVTDYISIGDYVLTGGELPAMVMIDAISRLVPGVLSNEVSAEFESFHDNLLEYPQYSRPEEWRGKSVPKILLSGNHTNIEGWRREHSILRTRERRPDLYEQYVRDQKEQEALCPKKKKLKGVIFDMDGCLVDSEGIYMEGWLSAFEEKQIPISRELVVSWNGLGGCWIDEMIDEITGDHAETIELRALREKHILKALKEGRMKLHPYAKEILLLVKEKGLKLGMASCTVTARAKQILEYHGIFDLFDFTVFGEEVKEMKPSPDLYLMALKKSGLSRKETLVFEDSVSGVQAAKAAGLRPVYIPDERFGKARDDLPYYKKISDFLEGMALIRKL